MYGMCMNTCLDPFSPDMRYETCPEMGWQPSLCPLTGIGNPGVRQPLATMKDQEDSAESSAKIGQISLTDLLLWLLIFAYVILNLALNSFNAYLLGPKQAGHLALEIPVFYTLCHQVTIVLFTSVWLYFVPEMRFNGLELFKSNWFQLICVSTIYAASIATNNASFATVSLTVNTIFKAAIPFPTIIFSYFIEGKTYSIRVLACVGVLVFGTLLSMPYGGSGSPGVVGYCLVIFSMLATSIRPVISSVLMHTSKNPLSGVAMTFFDAFIAIWVLTPFSLIFDVWMHQGIVNTFTGDLAARNYALVGFGCFMAGFYGPATFYVIKLTSSLTYIIIGNTKQLVLLLGAAALVDKETRPLLWIGVTIGGCASITYAYQTAKERDEKAAAAAIAAKSDAVESTPLKGP